MRLTLYVQLCLSFQDGVRGRGHLTGPASAVSLLEAGHPEAARVVHLEPASLGVVSRREVIGAAIWRLPPTVRARRGPNSAGDEDLLSLEANELAVLSHARVPPHDTDAGVRGGGGELTLGHCPHLTLPHSLIPGLEARDDQTTLTILLSCGGQPPILPHPASAHRVDGLVGGFPEADGGCYGGGAAKGDNIANTGDDVRRVRRNCQAGSSNSLQ